MLSLFQSLPLKHISGIQQRARALKDEDFSDNGTLHCSKELPGILHSSPNEVVHDRILVPCNYCHHP